METREVTINEKDLLAAYRAGNEDQKAVLENGLTLQSDK